MAKQTHAHRIFSEDSDIVTCECGKEFADDDAWRDHYEKSHSKEERLKLEGRDLATARPRRKRRG